MHGSQYFQIVEGREFENIGVHKVTSSPAPLYIGQAFSIDPSNTTQVIAATGTGIFRGFLTHDVVADSTANRKTNVLDVMLGHTNIPSLAGLEITLARPVGACAIQVEGENLIELEDEDAALGGDEANGTELTFLDGKWALALEGDFVHGLLRRWETPWVDAEDIRAAIDLVAHAYKVGAGS